MFASGASVTHVSDLPVRRHTQTGTSISGSATPSARDMSRILVIFAIGITSDPDGIAFRRLDLINCVWKYAKVDWIQAWCHPPTLVGKSLTLVATSYRTGDSPTLSAFEVRLAAFNLPTFDVLECHR